MKDDLNLSRSNLRRIAELVHNEAGIELSQEKSEMVRSRLSKRLRATRIRGFDEYCAFVETTAGAEERRKMLQALTTNVTRFNREPHHFRDLREEVLTGLAANVRRGGRLRIWSSACSTGEEPYSIALAVLSVLPDAANHDVKILATDIDLNVVEKAGRGIYSPKALRDVDPVLRATHFDRRDVDGESQFQAGPSLRQLVTFRELNLIKPWPMSGPFEAIFCRNVMIYFSRDTQETLLERFVPLLSTGGTLYLGHSERVGGVAASALVTAGLTTFRLECG